jgi:hypothetical protein
MRPKQALPFLPWTQSAEYTIDGNVFDIEQVPWLRTPAQDTSREKVFRKGSQAAVSSLSLGLSMHGADQFGQRWIYFLPTDDEMDDFVADRVEKTLSESDYLRSRLGGTDNRGLKHLGPGLIYFRGLWTKRRAKSVPADGLVFDEIDEHKPENIALGEDRVLASKFQNKIYLSVPSFSGYGIDKLFADSDQHFFLHKCSSCGKWNHLDDDFPENFIPVAAKNRKSWPDGTTHYRGCRWCKAKLDVRQGEWVPKQRDKRRRGYHVSRLYTLTFPPDFPNAATYLMWECEDSQGSQEKLSRWFISFRALPFDGEGARITDDLLLSKELKNDTGFFYDGSGTVMGVDQGNRIHVSIYLPRPGNRMQLVYCEVTERWGRVSDLFRRHGCYLGVCDRGPDIHSARRFAAEFKGRVFLQSFGNDEMEEVGNTTRRRVKDDLHDGRIPVPWVTVNKEATLDATVDFVDTGHLILPNRKRLTGGDLREYEEYRLNLTNLKWKFEDTPSGQRRKTYLRNENHHGMGLNSARIGAYELGVKPPPTGVGPVFLSWHSGGNA